MRDDDRIAFVTYSDGQNLVQPLARVADVRARLQMTIPTVEASGGTMIPQALELGANVLSMAPSGFARRVVLISDGQDGSGQSIEQVAFAVRERADHGVTVSSLGVGADYDERFMTRVADSGRGNYEFLRDGSQLAGFLSRELRQASATTVDQAVAEITLPNGWHLNRTFGAESTGNADHIALPVGALFAGDERTVVLDLTVDAGSEGSAGALVARVHYRAVPEANDVSIEAGALALRVVGSEADANGTRDLAVFASTQSVVLAQNQREAVEAWRHGDAVRATQIAQDNARALQQIQTVAPSPALAAQATEYNADALTFQSTSAGSEAGRSYSLHSNSSNRARQVRAIGF
jgi:Ca-activated chloride channel family protein